MDDTPAKKTPGDNINKLDLSALEAFQFGTQWDESGESKRGAGERAPQERARELGAPRRDRRPPRREPTHGPEREAQGGEGPPARSFRGPGGGGGPREGRGPGGPRPYRDQREGREDRGGRFERGPRREGGGPRRPLGPPRPYQSPDLELTFYPDDHGFNALVKAMRASSRTYELFEIARLILGKLERCVVVYRRRAREGEPSTGLFISVPDGLPFPTEEEAVAHALDAGLSQFFDTETVQVDPPKGSFQFVNRCPITKELLGPPNYHRYPQILQQHYSTRGIHMPFDRYKASIEVVRDEETVKAWIESMKTATRYTFKGESPEGPAVFDNLEEARVFLLRTSRDKLVRQADLVRVPAKVVEAAGRTEAARAMHGMLEMQRRFPLDTANALRGRLRRENFHIFKRGSKGVTYVCAVRRKFRQPGQVFSESIDQLIDFLEKHPLLPVSELAPRMLGIVPPSAPAAPAAAPPEAPAVPAASPASEAAPAPETAPAPESAAPEPEVAPAHAPESAAPESAAPEPGGAPASEPAPAPGSAAPEAAEAPPPAPAEAAEPRPEPVPEPAAELTPAQKAVLNRLALDLRWLVSEGYVAEYSDGRLFVHPVMEPEKTQPEEPPPEPEAEAAPEAAEEVPGAGGSSSGEEPVASEPVDEEARVAEAEPTAPSTPPPADDSATGTAAPSRSDEEAVREPPAVSATEEKDEDKRSASSSSE